MGVPMYRKTADSGCENKTCPLMAEDLTRGTTALQGYPVRAEADGPLGPTPAGELRIELGTDVFELMLAQHLSDEALTRIVALRT